MIAGARFGLFEWTAIGALPLAGIALAVVTARVTVLAALRRML
jgi:cell division transport system permease protein